MNSYTRVSGSYKINAHKINKNDAERQIKNKKFSEQNKNEEEETDKIMSSMKVAIAGKRLKFT